MLQKRINVEFLKLCFEFYRNSWFLINKKIKNKYRMINAAMNMNEVIIRDVNLSFNVEEFSKEFARMCVAFLIDFFFEYDQMILIEKFRDLTAFMTFLNLFRMTRLSQSAINSMTKFVRIIIEIFRKYNIILRCWPFVKDINIKDSRLNYDKKEILFKIWLFIIKHIQWLNAVLVNLEKTKCTISNEKFQFCRFESKIVDFVCDSNHKFSEIAKIIKILDWSSCCNVSKVWIFIDACVYYRIWIINFIIIAFFIYRLLKNEQLFVWAEEQKNIMNILKLILTTASTLKFLNYSFLTDEIMLTVNFNLKKWSAILFQINSGTNKNHSARYESDLWIMFESKYNVTKRECRELLKTLKKVRFWLYEMRFIIEINVNILIVQLNRSAADFSEILMTC